MELPFIGSGTADAGDQYVGLDRFGRVVLQKWVKSGTSTDEFGYTYDRDGNRTARGNVVTSGFDESYTYDSLNQLASFARGGTARTQSFDYDAVGNRDGVTTNGSTQTYTANKQNEITSVSGATTPTYDANGNMTTDETGRQFVYDAWNKLKVVKNSSGTTLKTYLYDAMGRRVAETAGGTTTDLYYSAGWQVLEEAVGGTTKMRYVWSPVYVDAMILRDRDTDANGTLDERLYALHDANFNVTALVNTSGVVVERYVYDAYGAVTVLDASWAVQSGGSAYAWVHLHQGGRYDAVSGLYHFRNRDYSAALGRWVTMDPIRYEAGDVNLFRSLLNSPLGHNDPSGLDVYIFYLEGAQLGGAKSVVNQHLEDNIIKPLKKLFAEAQDIHWKGYKVGKGLEKDKLARTVEGDLANQCESKPNDSIVLIGYSWGGYAVTEALRLAYLTPAGEARKATFRADLVYTIDPVIGVPGWNRKDTHSNGDFQTGERKHRGLWGEFGKWTNWYQQEDDGGSITGVKVRGAYLDDPKITNKKYAAADFTNPKGAHVEITTKKDIRDEIEKGIKSLRK